MSTKFRYTLSRKGAMRCENNEFFLQKTPDFKGHTRKIFMALYGSKPKTLAEISEEVGIKRRDVNGIISFNINAGYIRRIPLHPL